MKITTVLSLSLSCPTTVNLEAQMEELRDEGRLLALPFSLGEPAANLCYAKCYL